MTTVSMPRRRSIDAHLVKFQSESGRDGDGDYHLVISDDTLLFTKGGTHSPASPHSLVAEIPKPECVPGRNGDPSTRSVFQTQLVAVRTKFERQFPNITGGWNEADGIAVRITGVAFFDFPHGQVGGAKNVVEIHPILDITFNPAPGPPLPTPTPTTLIVQNPGFEDGMQNWVASDGVITNDGREPARTGNWKAWLGGYGSSHTDTLCKQVPDFT
jgi:hypothetical protein